MCGIIGYAGSDIKNFNRHKLNLIGVYNDSRGGDSCGVSVDGKIKKGIGNMKLFRSFISVNEIRPEEHPTVIAHTRKSSVGVISKANAHPFEFGINEDTIEATLIGCHNGTIHNHKELAEEYNIETSVSVTTVGVKGALSTTVRSKTDSQIILQILAENPGNYDVLSKYYGGAALLWYNPAEPNIVYVFKGESKKYSTSTITEEERPLFYYNENNSGLYISSLEDPLFAIGGNTDNVDEFETNVVYKIIDGDIDNAEKIEIDRSKVHQSVNFKYGTSSRSSQYNNDNYNDSRAGYSYLNKFLGEDDDDVYQNPQLPFNNARFPATITKDLIENSMFNIHDERVENKEHRGMIYCERLRYKRNGHLINGVYTYVKDYGFVFLSANIESATKEFKRIIGKSFNNGHFVVGSNKAEKYVPYPKSKFRNNDVYPLFYFLEGVMLRTANDYGVLKDNRALANGVKALSEASKYPITLHKKKQPAGKQRIYYNSSPFTGTVAPLGSNYIYTVANGNAIKKENVDVNFTEVISKKTRNPQETKKDLLKLISNDLAAEPKKFSKEVVAKRAEQPSNELLLMAAHKNVLPMYANMSEVIGQIKKYDGSATRLQILNSLTVISNEFEKIIKLGENVK